MKKIKLLTNYASPERCVSLNQIASFEDAEADQLLKLGYAELIEVIAEAEIVEEKKDLQLNKELETADLKPAEEKKIELKRKELFKK